MVSIPLPLTEWRLLLTPRWGDQSVAVQVAAGALCLVPLALVVWLYRYELRLVSRRVAAALLGLRTAVVLLLLFIIAYQPVVGRTLVEELPGRVLVAFDRSASMDVVDPQRPVGDKLRLARALKLGADLCDDRELGDWIARAEPGKDAPLTEARQAAHDQLCQRVDRLTRRELGQRLLAADGKNLLATLAARHRVEVLGFARDAWELPRDVAEWADAGDPARRQATDLRQPLLRAPERTGADQGRVLGVVLVTDGGHNAGDEAPAARALDLGEQGIPLFPIGLGAHPPVTSPESGKRSGAAPAPPAVALAAVKAPSALFKDVDAVVEARFKVTGLPAQDIEVELQPHGKESLKETLRHRGVDAYYTVQFTVRVSEVGTQTLTLQARAREGKVFDAHGNPQPGRVPVYNNNRALAVNVSDDKARVLVIDGEARWEYHYLASALARDRTVLPTNVVFDQPRLGGVSEEALAQMKNPARALPAGPDALAAYDCILLGDVAPGQLPAEDRSRLEKYVADRGGTLVFVAGKRALPLAYLGGDTPAEDPLRRLLPLEEARAVNPNLGFPVTLTHEGKRVPFLQLDPAPDRSERLWADLPRHYWGAVGRAKRGASPLAYVAGDRESGDPGRDQALVVRQHYGFGRVLYVGLDSTWRWRYKTGDLYHHRFWGQVIRWAATDKPLVGGNDAVRFGAREPVYREGDKIDLVVRLGEDVPALGADAVAGARVLRPAVNGQPEAAVALVPLTRREAQPRVLEGQVNNLPAGPYVVELALPDLAERLRNPAAAPGEPANFRAPFAVSPAAGDEMIELATNWPLLDDLAAKSGGQVFTAENVDRLAELLTQKGVRREHRLESRVWHWWLTLVVILTLLTAEWATRKGVGLP